MTQSPISQRLKILIEKLGLDTRSFSQALGVSEGTTRNYFNRGSKPNADYLEKLSISFESANLHWLLTGNGEPLIPPTYENSHAIAGNQNFFKSPVAAQNTGTTNQQQYNTSSDAHDEIKTKLVIAEKEIEHLRAQLTMKDTVIASKDETITALRASANRPS